MNQPNLNNAYITTAGVLIAIFGVFTLDWFWIVGGVVILLGTTLYDYIWNKDDALAMWWTKGAEQGEADAQVNLGLAYYDGKGVRQDFVMAYMWISLAAEQGHELARNNKDILTKEMTAADVSKAQTLSRECLAQNYKNCGH